ncbi:MAG: P-loop ATPase, Sll1717 family [Acidobacteriaceae bacterium]
MKQLDQVENFGGTDADNDDILLQAFEDHEAYLDVLALRRHMIIGKKGSGKTAIFKKLITTRASDFFAYGHTFSDYPWHHHERQARIGIPDFDKYTHSWKYLILLSVAKVALNQDQSLPCDDTGMEQLLRLESFVVDTYGSRDPDLSQVFSPTKHLKLKPHFEMDWKIFRAGVSPESVPVTELPVIIQEVNAVFSRTVLQCLNPAHKYYIAFDQLDLGFELNSPEYTNRLIGLLLAGRDINLAAREANIQLFVVIFLRDDIYDCLHFEDKNKMTENFVSFIEWDTPRTKKTLKALMERRFAIVLGEGNSGEVKWEEVFNETREMPGHQDKYEHMRDRTYLRPRDFIKFTNCALARYKERFQQGSSGPDDPVKIDNVDVHNARIEFSEYFLREIDDEVHKHMPNYDQELDVLRSLGKWQFERPEFEAAYQQLQQTNAKLSAAEVLEKLYEFSFIGFYRAGGRGFGGSEYMSLLQKSEHSVIYEAGNADFRIGLSLPIPK